MFQLRNHQKTALAYLRLNDSFALFMEQGTGKTLVTLVRVHELLSKGDIENCLIVSPKSAIGAWQRDMELFDGEDRKLLESKTTVVNYDKFSRSKSRSEYERTWDCIVLDEAHFIKNRTSNRSKFLLNLACGARYRYILTGTPISNGQMENIWSLYTFLKPLKVRGRIQSEIFGGSFTVFEKRYCILNQYHKPSQYIHVDELQDIISDYSYRVLKSECLDLPDKLPDELVKVDNLCKREYAKLAKESALLDYDLVADNPLSRLVKLRQMCSGHLKTDDGDIPMPCAKTAYLREIIESCGDKKLVIFAEFKQSINDVCNLLEDMKLKHVRLDGSQKNKEIWRDFQSDESVRVIVCQYQTASAGIDLFASDTCIFYEPTLKSNTLEQARDRIHRNGQTQKCSYIHLLVKGTVEVDIYHALAGYADFSKRLFEESMTIYRRGR